ncbi:MAG: IS1634 family transposase [Bacillota bacterium]
MFVKKGWSYYKDKKYVSYNIVESYRDPDTGNVRHRNVLNITPLPKHVIESIDQAFKTGDVVDPGQITGRTDIHMEFGDTVRGAGLLSVYRAWKQQKVDGLLSALTAAEKESVLAMVAQRILEPGSKLGLKEQFSDTILSRIYSKKRLNEDELYRVMDRLHEQFYAIQDRIQKREDAAPVLLLYDCTSTYFEGQCAEDGRYGYSRDKRWDRYQVVVGLVCSIEGIPLALEVWPGDTPDKSTVIEQVQMLKERFRVKKAIFVGDKGMYQETSIEEIEKAGFDYILSMEWKKQRKQLEALGPHQLSLFDEMGVVEWEEDGVRYVGCMSELKKYRAQSRREAGMQRAEEQLARIAATARKGRYYSWVSLRTRIRDILNKEGVSGLWKIEVAPLQDMDSPEDRIRLDLTFEPNEGAIDKRKSIEGKYVLQTSLDSEEYSAQKVDEHYRRLMKTERAFRHIKTYLKIRPVYHYKRERVRAHVLICFLAYYLVKKMELQMREAGENREVERVLRHWDKLRISHCQVHAGDHNCEQWDWALGDEGQKIKDEISSVGWWRSLQGYWRGLRTQILQ